MKILTSFVAALFAGACLSLVQAQTLGDDFTTELENAGFEGENSTTTGNGRIFVPNGWTFQRISAGWNDFRVVNSNEVASDGKNSYFESYEGNRHVSYWGQNITALNLYQEVATLPKGAYQFSAMVRLVTHQSDLTNEQKITDQHLYAKIIEGDSTVSSVMPLSAVGDAMENWTPLEVLFNIKADGDIVRLGISSTNDGSNDAGGFQIDDCKITFLGDGNAFVVQAWTAIDLYKVRASDIINGDIAPSGVMDDLEKALALVPAATTIEEKYAVDSATLDAAVTALKTACKNAEECLVLQEKLIEQIEAALNHAKGPDAKPGKEDFENTAYDLMDIYYSEVEYLVYKSDIEKALVTMAAAQRKYDLSVLEGATAASPKDATWVISCPNFTKVDGDPSLAADALSTNWKISYNSTVTKEFRLNTVAGKNCWNSWSNDFTYMTVYQELTDLPAGMYSISCQTATNNPINDQHAYITSSTGTAVSSIPTIVSPEGTFASVGIWEPLETGKVLVGSDGKLTIGMTSTSGGDASGWFCVTDFELKYYGMENALTEYQSAYAAQIAYAKELAQKEMLKTEQSGLNSSIATAEAQDISSIENIETAFEALNKVIADGTTYTQAMSAFKNKNYKTLTNLATAHADVEDYTTLGGVYSGYLSKVDDILAADTTTAASYNELNRLMGIYVSFDKEFAAAVAYKDPEKYDEEVILTLGNTLEGIAKSLETLNPADVAAASSKLSTAIYNLKVQITDKGAEATFWLTNPSFDESSLSTGWAYSSNFKRNTAQMPLDDGFTGTACAEIWVASNGKLADSYISQNAYVPNGIYTITVAAKAVQQGTINILEEDGETVKETITITSPVTGVWFFANNDSIEISTPMDGTNEIRANEPHSQLFKIENVEITNNSLNVGLKTVSTIANWVALDHVQIYCMERTQGVGVVVVDQDAIEPLQVYEENGYIRVAGVEEFTISTLNGMAISANTQLVPGTYIIKAGSRSAKIAITE